MDFQFLYNSCTFRFDRLSAAYVTPIHASTQ